MPLIHHGLHYRRKISSPFSGGSPLRIYPMPLDGIFSLSSCPNLTSLHITRNPIFCNLINSIISQPGLISTALDLRQRLGASLLRIAVTPIFHLDHNACVGFFILLQYITEPFHGLRIGKPLRVSAVPAGCRSRSSPSALCAPVSRMLMVLYR